MAEYYEFLTVLFVAIIQGITEWFPVSSSGHLVVSEFLLKYEADLMFDVALHFGTLMAVFVYFGRDIVDIVKDFLSGNWKSENGRTGLLIVVATIPAALIGFFFKDFIESSFDSLIVVALGFGLSGLVLLIVAVYSPRRKAFENFGYRDAFFVGCAQVFALLPGISRSGMTLAAGILIGLKEREAAKFSFLMSVPIIFGANILAVGNNSIPSNLIWATLVTFVVGLFAIHILFNYVFVNKKNLLWFSIYALILSLILIVWVAIDYLY